MFYFVQPFKKIFDFTGRARKKEYWSYIAFLAIIFIILNFIIDLVLIYLNNDSMIDFFIKSILFLIFVGLSLSITVRRFHDIGKSAWWIILDFIPPLCIITIVFKLMDSQEEANKYGPNPKIGEKKFEGNFHAFHKLLDFSGRARRREYWELAVFSNLLSFILCIIIDIVVLGLNLISFDSNKTLEILNCIIVYLTNRILLLSVTVRRYHDIGMPAWMIILDFLPGLYLFKDIEYLSFLNITTNLLPTLYLIIFILKIIDGQKITNKYGPSPKYEINTESKKVDNNNDFVE